MRAAHLASILAVVLVAGLVWAEADSLLALRLEAPGYLAALVPLFMVNLWAVSRANQLLLRALSVDLGHTESLALTVVSRFGNLVAPLRAGAAARAVYLKRRHAVPVSQFVSLLAILQLLFLFMASAAALAVGSLHAGGLPPSMPLTVAQGSVLVGTAIVLLVPLRLPRRPRALVARLQSAVEGWRRMLERRDLLLQALACAALQLVTGAGMFWAEFQLFGVDLGFDAAIYIAAAFALEGIVGLTPAGLGVREALVVVAAQAMGAPEGVPVAAALVHRVLAMGVTAAMLAWAGSVLEDEQMKESG